VSGRRNSRRRRRPAPAAAPPSADQAEDTGRTEAPENHDEPGPAEASTERDSGFGRAALILALLLGTLLEQIAFNLLSGDALRIFHLLVAVGVALLVARWYRGFMRRTLARARGNRRTRRSNRK
jgi:hypothetical protein